MNQKFVLKFALRLLVTLVLIVGVGTFTAQANEALLFEDNFDSGAFQSYNGGAGWNQTQFTESSTGEIVNSPTRSGSGAAKFTLNYPDRRVEKNKFYAAGGPGAERWFGFSTYLPSDWVDHDNFTIVNQIKGYPDRDEPYRSPMLSMEVRNGQWNIYSRWDSNQISRPARNGNGGTIQSSKIYEGSYEKGQWTDWVIHVKWSYGSDGLLEIWKNGTKVVSRTGPNCYNDRENTFHFKIGMYKPGFSSGDPSPLVFYHDEVKIGDGRANYETVAPASQTAQTVSQPQPTQSEPSATPCKAA